MHELWRAQILPDKTCILVVYNKSLWKTCLHPPTTTSGFSLDPGAPALLHSPPVSFKFHEHPSHDSNLVFSSSSITPSLTFNSTVALSLRYYSCRRAFQFHLPVLYCTQQFSFYAFSGWQAVALSIRKTSPSKSQTGLRIMASHIRFAPQPHRGILRVTCCSIMSLMVRQSCRIQENRGAIGFFP